MNLYKGKEPKRKEIKSVAQLHLSSVVGANGQPELAGIAVY